MAEKDIANKLITFTVQGFIALVFCTVSIVGTVLGAMYNINGKIDKVAQNQEVYQTKNDGRQDLQDLTLKTLGLSVDVTNTKVNQLAEKLK